MSHVLIVEDEKEIQDIVYEILTTKLFCQVDRANNGLEGFIKAKEKKYDLIITDHKMPFMLGSALVIAIRSMENKNTNTPIVFLSAFISDELKQSMKIPDITYIEKPFEVQKFIEEIKFKII